jgi:hypothetical protein
MALINAKEKEHEASKLAADSRQLIESATQKWTKIATDISKAGFSTHYRGAMACKDKWQTLFTDFKKICDYKAATGSREDYFHMGSKRRNELTLPPNFCSSHFREMEKFLSQQPCLNPPCQVDSFIDKDNDFQSTEELARFCAQNQITQSMLEGDEAAGDPALKENLPAPGVGGSAGPRLPQKPPVSAFHAAKGKDKLENTAKNLTPDPPPINIAVRRRQSSSQSKMVEVTEMQGKEIVNNMQKLNDMEEKKVAAAVVIADKQLQYFKLRDSEIAITQRGLVQAVNGLSQAIVHAYASHTSAAPPQGTWPPNSHPVHTAAGTGHGSPTGVAPLAPGPILAAWDSPQRDCNDDMTASVEGQEGAAADIFAGTNMPMEDSDGHINIDATSLA